MQEYAALDVTLGNSMAGMISLVLFVVALIIDRKGTRTWSSISALIIAGIASFVLYASTWAAMCVDLVSDILDGLGGVFGVDEMPLRLIYAAACVTAIIVIISDLKTDFQNNPWAVACLFIAPITVHGTGGFIGAFLEGAFGGIALALLDLLQRATGI